MVMMLDITAYPNVALKRSLTVTQANEEDYDPGPNEEALLYVDHPTRTQHDGMPEGIYNYLGKPYGFRAGSYGGYNAWRSELARLIGTTDEEIWRNPQPGPFVELIHFSDCEGFMGPQTSKKLAADFDAWEERAAKHVPGSGWGAADAKWFIDAYRRWSKAFHLAADGGAVQFH